MTAQDIIHEIRAGHWTLDDVNAFIQAGINARAQLNRDRMRELRPGMQVQFTSGRDGRVYAGQVVETKQKNVIVNTGQGRYRVPASMLEIV